MPIMSGAPLIARLEADLYHIPLPAFLVDRDEGGFRFRSVNPAFEAATGSSADDIEGRYLDAMMGGDIVDILLPEYRACWQLAERRNFDLRLSDRPGGTSWHIALAPLLDRSGDVIGLHGQAVDVTSLTDDAVRESCVLLAQIRAREAAQILLDDTVVECAAITDDALRAACSLRDEGKDADPGRLAALIDGLQSVQRIHSAAARVARRLATERFDRPLRFEDICAEVCARWLDETRFRVSFGEAELTADRLLLTTALRTLVIAAAAHAVRWIELDVFQSDTNLLCVTVRDDRRLMDGGGPLPHPVLRLEHLVHEHGGGLAVHPGPRWHEVQIYVPGLLHEKYDTMPEQIAL